MRLFTIVEGALRSEEDEAAWLDTACHCLRRLTERTIVGGCAECDHSGVLREARDPAQVWAALSAPVLDPATYQLRLRIEKLTKLGLTWRSRRPQRGAYHSTPPTKIDTAKRLV